MDADRSERLGDIADDQLTDTQRTAIQRIVSGPRGGIAGPFVPLLRSPDLMNHLQAVGAFLRFQSSLPSQAIEVAVLAVARHWDQQFEWGHHHPLAVESGVPLSVIDEIEQRQRPTSGPEALAVTWDCATMMLDTGELDDATYDAGLAVLTEQGLVELIVTVGYYTTLAFVMNVAHTPAPPGPRLTIDRPSRARLCTNFGR
ncbi:carboxymuconolactone decarboxylase family protein [Streptomyces sp. Tu102]|uniref:carboxymuconolactone decarboxylase family protein n=1 Tax=Streptomyces TaxID=1883 RepID=UPI001BDC8AE3|nr:hypothetical protein [Streptomyces sp. Tu102]MBT1098062.1 hypothetical protein [Streptomyces sp. Tu102]